MIGSLNAELSDETNVLNGISASWSGRLVDASQSNHQDLMKRRRSLEEAVQYASVRAGFEAGHDATEQEIARRVNKSMIGQSTKQVVDAFKDSIHAWQVANDTSAAAVDRALGALKGSHERLTSSWNSVVKGFEHLNVAGEAVQRAGRAVRWDREAARVAANLAESSHATVLDADIKVQSAEEEVAQAEQVANWNEDSVDVLERAVDTAEDETTAGSDAFVNAGAR